MKSVTRINVLALAVVAFCISMLVVVASGQTAQAYTCEWSNNGGNTYTSESGDSGILEYSKGTCIFVKPDGDGSAANSAGECPRDRPLNKDGKCYHTRIEYTNIKPTNDDGSQVSEQDWNALCQGSDFDKYNSERHRCENSAILFMGNELVAGCTLKAWDPDSIDGDCEAPGNGNAKTLEEIRVDPTTAKVDECTNAAGSTWDPTKQQCNWTEEGCPQKNGGQGLWLEDSKECKSYTDYSNSKEDCDSVGGEFLQNPKDPSHWQCQKPGTTFDDGKDDPITKAPQGKTPTTAGRCGKARVNILECDGATDSASVFTSVLRVGVIALSMVVGAAALAGLVWASLQYARASDDQGTLSDAKNRIRDIVIGLFLYGFIMAIINFLVPGGIF